MHLDMFSWHSVSSHKHVSYVVDCAGGPRTATVWCTVQLQHKGRWPSHICFSWKQPGMYWLVFKKYCTGVL